VLEAEHVALDGKYLVRPTFERMRGSRGPIVGPRDQNALAREDVRRCDWICVHASVKSSGVNFADGVADVLLEAGGTVGEIS
jgi:hypothetical protein